MSARTSAALPRTLTGPFTCFKKWHYVRHASARLRHDQVPAQPADHADGHAQITQICTPQSATSGGTDLRHNEPYARVLLGKCPHGESPRPGVGLVLGVVSAGPAR